MLNGGSLIGRIIPSMFAQKAGIFNVMIPCIYSSILIFCTLAVNSAAGIILFSILYGFFQGSRESVLYIYYDVKSFPSAHISYLEIDASLIAPVVGTTAVNDAEIGARLGVCFTFMGVGGLIGALIGLYIHGACHLKLCV